MAISNINELKAKLSRTLFHQRFAGEYDDAIIMFEAVVNRRLRVRKMERTQYLTLDHPPTGRLSGLCDLPDDYGVWRAVNWTGRTPYVELDYVHPAYLNSTGPSVANGDPQVFTIEGLTFYAQPSDYTAGAFEFHYYGTIDSIVAASNGGEADNWLLLNFPDAYLFGVLTELFALGRNIEGAQLYKARRDEVFAEIIQLSALTTGATSSKVREAEYF